MHARQDDRIAGCAFQRFVGQIHHVVHAETGRQSPEPHRREVPIGIATRALEEVELALHPGNECRAKLGEQGGILANGRGQSGFKSTGFIGHDSQHMCDAVKFRFRC